MDPPPPYQPFPSSNAAQQPQNNQQQWNSNFSHAGGTLLTSHSFPPHGYTPREPGTVRPDQMYAHHNAQSSFESQRRQDWRDHAQAEYHGRYTAGGAAYSDPYADHRARASSPVGRRMPQQRRDREIQYPDRYWDYHARASSPLERRTPREHYVLGYANLTSTSSAPVQTPAHVQLDPASVSMQQDGRTYSVPLPSLPSGWTYYVSSSSFHSSHTEGESSGRERSRSPDRSTSSRPTPRESRLQSQRDKAQNERNRAFETIRERDEKVQELEKFRERARDIIEQQRNDIKTLNQKLEDAQKSSSDKLKRLSMQLSSNESALDDRIENDRLRQSISEWISALNSGESEAE